MARKNDDTARKIISSHTRGQFRYPQFSRPEPKATTQKRYPVRLLVDGEPCGCRFGMADGFKHDPNCEHHAKIVATIKRTRKNFKPQRLPFADPAYVEAKTVERAIPGFREELLSRYETQDQARRDYLLDIGLNPRKVKTLADVPAKHRQAFADFMHGFSVTQEQVAAALPSRPTKKVHR